MANILIVGGAGYIGSTTCAWLEDAGHTVTVLDDLSTGFRSLVRSFRFVQARAGDSKQVEELFRGQTFDCVMHFAARALVSECFEKEAEYFENNVEETRRLVKMMVRHGVRKLVFSSTCAVYGTPSSLAPLNEETPTCPVNPYGASKLAAETVVSEFAREAGLQAISLRYFNAAGAEAKLRCGELHDPETHLIPLVLRAALTGETLTINGADYPTPDGTCVRDYIHVSDLAEAHGHAMMQLLETREPRGFHKVYNLGSERGVSVREILAAAEALTGKNIHAVVGARRPGDPPMLVASTAKAGAEFRFRPRFSDLAMILSSALAWEQKGASR